MIPAHTPVGTVVVQVNYDDQDRASLVVTKIVEACESGSHPFSTAASRGLWVASERLYALADLVAQAAWTGADVLKALGVKLGSDVSFVEVLKSLGREADLRELEALRERAAKWDALMKPSNMPIISMPPDPAPDLAIAAERIASACEAINARLESVIGSRYLDTGAPRMAEVDFIRIGEVGE